ncbi:unnamed protein product [Rotaria sordida]|uniref:Uncharacterized protein n=1 Tax=Rotaria sordida TaxID=392033 RepID=A0A815S5A8_9BILA|nr:unnamed protein product [Rotaria sordida]CAF1487325.1 unnamed protein product [Rotaria sordida]CAF3949316.1 unnamed protein product [Rotaria sordida]CAF4024369.1 unnamed protein product [Rotaria sordida]
MSPSDVYTQLSTGQPTNYVNSWGYQPTNNDQYRFAAPSTQARNSIIRPRNAATTYHGEPFNSKRARY